MYRGVGCRRARLCWYVIGSDATRCRKGAGSARHVEVTCGFDARCRRPIDLIHNRGNPMLERLGRAIARRFKSPLPAAHAPKIRRPGTAGLKAAPGPCLEEPALAVRGAGTNEVHSIRLTYSEQILLRYFYERAAFGSGICAATDAGEDLARVAVGRRRWAKAHAKSLETKGLLKRRGRGCGSGILWQLTGAGRERGQFVAPLTWIAGRAELAWI
jgi:hypothetical protein